MNCDPDVHCRPNMHCHPDPELAEGEGPVVCGHLQILALIALIVLTPLTLHAQNKTAPPAKPPVPHNAPHPEDPQLYRNATYAFRYQIPYGWVDRTKPMQEGSESGKSDALLAVFERPPEATGDTINSAVVIASESASSYPGLKKAEDYLGPLTELATSKGFKPEGEPNVIEVDARQLVRADFIKQLNDKLTMRQCSLILLAKGQILSFTFIAGSEDELENLIDGLHFATAKPTPH